MIADTMPNRYILSVLVTSTNTAKVTSLFDGKDLTGKKLKINIGDEVAWLVQIVLPGGLRPAPGYTLTFNDSSFFGQASLGVQAGGLSPYLTVLQVQDTVKYTLAVPSAGFTLDPEIQSGPDISILKLKLVPDIVITWDATLNSISYTGGVAVNATTVGAHLNNVIEFVVTAGTGLSMVFGGTDNQWMTPFYQSGSLTLPGSGTPPSIIRPVNDSAEIDNNAIFPFNGYVTNGGPLKSPLFNIQTLIP
jgi:hypothetical protein